MGQHQSVELGELPLPEVAPGELGMRHHQPRLPHRAIAEAHDVEIEHTVTVPTSAATPAPATTATCVGAHAKMDCVTDTPATISELAARPDGWARR